MIYLPGNEADCIIVNLKEKATHLYPETMPRNNPKV